MMNAPTQALPLSVRLFLAVCPLLASAAPPAEGSLIPPPAMESGLAQENAGAVPREKTSVVVLGYGILGNAPGQLSPEAFERQMLFLKQSGIRPISLGEMIDWRVGKKTLPAHCVLLTFDEAQESFYQYAAPVLKRCGFPYVIFVDGRNLRGEAGCLTPQQLQELVQNGAELGSHSLNRRQAADWQREELANPLGGQFMAEEELGESARRIRNLSGECRAFSYPDGYSDVLMMRNMASFGYKLAFSRTGGKAGADAPAYLMPRNMVGDETSFARALADIPAPARRELESAPAPAGKAGYIATLADLPDDDVAEEVEDGQTVSADTGKTAEPEKAEPGSAEPPAPAPAVIGPSGTEGVQPVCGVLGKRTPDGDWVSTQFKKAVVPREETQVAVLGYHNFSNYKPVSEMRMRTAEFCQQMQYIKDSDISVISLQDFLEWRLGQRQLPARCILITIDDGWKSTYTDAYPVLKAYGYPFTLFLYTRYINVHGDSMTSSQIKEMMGNGATIGSHSTNHLYPSKWKRYALDSPAYAEQVQREIPDSCAKLKELFGNCSAYCYPGGYHTPPMLAALKASPFKAAFTVVEKKVTVEEDPYLVHRYMVFGVDPRIFRRAVNFDGEAGVQAVQQGIREAETRARAFFPKAFEGVGDMSAPAADAAPAGTPEPQASSHKAEPKHAAPHPSKAASKPSSKHVGKVASASSGKETHRQPQKNKVVAPAPPAEPPQPAPAPEKSILKW